MPTVPRPRSSNDARLNLLVPGEWLDEAAELAPVLAEPGATLARADVLRMALRRGLDELQRVARKR